MRFVVTCPKGTEALVAKELAARGLDAGEPLPGAVPFVGPLVDAYVAGLWSRVGTRVLWVLAEEELPDPDALYEAVRAVDWSEHLGAAQTIAVDAVRSRDRVDHDARFLALRVKDAVVDAVRDREGERPSVDRKHPDVKLHLHWSTMSTLSVDLFGPLHRRGYRPKGAPAPLKENLAAAIVALSGWEERGWDEGAFLDPMCGSGTLLVEAALARAGVAPGRKRKLGAWRGHDRERFEELRAQSPTRARGDGIHGFDRDPEAVALAKQSLAAAGVEGARVRVAKLRELEAPSPSGTLVVNPPYGERLGEAGELGLLYERLGDVLKQRFGGWTAHVFTANRALEKRVGLRAGKRVTLYNGPLACRLSTYGIRASRGEGPGWRKASAESAPFANRLAKNLGKLEAWAKKERAGVWRAYDADVPEFNVAVDVYELEGEGRVVLVQEYGRPRKVDAERADRRLRDVVRVVEEQLSPVRVELRVRRRGARYGRRGEGGPVSVVREGGLRFGVNLSDYLDTGIFADQRKLRGRMAEEVGSGRFLNLFAYTCTASVYAAAAGARTTSVDMSSTYLDWGRQSFRENGLELTGHRFVRSDVERFVAKERERYELVFLAPPSYSKTKAGELDLQRDHGDLVGAAMELVATGGSLYFATHARGFTLDPALAKHFSVRDVRKAVVPRDYVRAESHVWRLRR